MTTITDMFCGAGGSSLGAQMAGAEIALAMNHWNLAIETHSANFPATKHAVCDISQADPRYYPKTKGLIASPECTSHTLAKGAKRKSLAQLDFLEGNKIDPAEERSRATMWDVPRFAEYHRYDFVIVENVVDVRFWVCWEAWLLAMTLLGYDYQCVFYNSMFAHPTPQSRDRIYIVFWRKGMRRPDLEFKPSAHCPKCAKTVNAVQSWKNPKKKWGKYKSQYLYLCPDCAGRVDPFYYCAWNVIDWSLPAQKIGERKHALKPKTMERIRNGLEKYGKQPIIVTNYTPGYSKSLSDPLASVTTVDHNALVSPFLVDTLYTNCAGGKISGITAPAPTQTGRQSWGMVSPYIVELKNNVEAKPVTEPLGTVVAGGNHHYLVQPFLINYSGDSAPLTSPVDTVVTRDKCGLILPETLEAEDCYFRMLQPHEIGRAMAFPDTYEVKGNNRDKVKQFGNAVTPPVMQMLVNRVLEVA